MAVALELAGRTEAAIRAYKRVLEVHLNHADALANLLAIAVDTGEESLRQSAARLLGVQPDSSAALMVVIESDFRREDFAAAAAHCEALVSAGASAGGDYEAWFNLAVAEHKSGRLESAIRHYRHALALRPRNGQAWLNLGLAYHETGELESAQRAYDRVLAAPPCRTLTMAAPRETAIPGDNPCLSPKTPGARTCPGLIVIMKQRAHWSICCEVHENTTAFACPTAAQRSRLQRPH
jgi:tetratricopeptide (TPR) repeat protein